MIRAFVAVPVPDDVTRALTAAQVGLPVGRPVAPENFHLTLAFMGEHPEPVIEDLHLALDEISAPAIEITLAGAGIFGTRRPRIFYAGVGSAPGLGHLRAKVSRAARDTGIELDRSRYTPHVTLARMPSAVPPEEAMNLRDFTAKRATFRAPPFQAQVFALFRSSLGRNGPVYDVLAEYPLTV